MSDTASTPAKATKGKVGETIQATEVIRPNGVTDRVGGSGYVLETVGTYVVDGTEVIVA